MAKVRKIQRGKSQQIHISLSDFKGSQYVDIRNFIKKGEDYLPTKKGISIPVDSLDSLIKKLKFLRREIQE